MNEMQGSSSSRDHHACHSNNTSISRYFHSEHTNVESKPPSRRFRKEDLLDAQVISQVDRKFIACLIQDDPGTAVIVEDDKVARNQVLVLIDQHAADERVRVERFLKDLCLGFLHHGDMNNGVQTMLLSPSVPVLLTRHEALRLADLDIFQGAFNRWGISFDDLASLSSRAFVGGLDNNACEEGYVQVFVRTIPAIVSDKVRPYIQT